MKKRINLLYKKKDYRNVEQIFSRLRVATYVLGFIVAIALLAIFVLKTSIKSKYEDKLSEKEKYYSELTEKKDVETKALYFNEKSTVLKSFLESDINFLPYYQLLESYLPVTTDYEVIELINFDNDANAEIVLSFSNYEDLYTHLSRFEDDQFLSIFENLTIKSFTLTEEESKSYELRLVGKFKPIENEAKN